MDAFWLLIPVAVLAVIIYITYMLHVFLRRRLNAIAANISTVAVIVLIATAVLFPVFSKARERSGPSCDSNMIQICLGFIQYVQDYDEKWPDMGSGGGYWASQIYSYEKSTGVYKCPDDPTQNTTTPTYVISYAANSNLGAHGGGHSQEVLSNPAATVMASDFDNRNRHKFHNVESRCAEQRKRSRLLRQLQPRCALQGPDNPRSVDHVPGLRRSRQAASSGEGVTRPGQPVRCSQTGRRPRCRDEGGRRGQGVYADV